MQAEVGMKEMDAAEKLVEQSPEGRGRDGSSDGLRVVVDDLLLISPALYRGLTLAGSPESRARHIRIPCKWPYPLG